MTGNGLSCDTDAGLEEQRILRVSGKEVLREEDICLHERK
jgi:hypothetical protein